MPLLLVSVAFVLLAGAAFEILWAPLAIVDAQASPEKGLLVSVQGPICYLHKFLAKHVHDWVSYSFRGTGMAWLDGADLRKTGRAQRVGRSRLQLPPQPGQPPFACATSKGFLDVSAFGHLFLLICMLLFIVLLLPTAVIIAFISGNQVQHVLVTILFFSLPLMLCALALHPAVAYLLRRQRTPLQEACQEYLDGLGPLPPTTGKDQPHPKSQGLAAGALLNLWNHFERFILERTLVGLLLHACSLSLPRLPA